MAELSPGVRWDDSWEEAIGFVGKEVSDWRGGPRSGVEVVARGQLRPIGCNRGSELLRICSISFQVQVEGDFHSEAIMSQPTCLLLLFFAMPHNTWDLSALARGSEPSSPLDHPGDPGLGRF